MPPTADAMAPTTSSAPLRAVLHDAAPDVRLALVGELDVATTGDLLDVVHSLSLTEAMDQGNRLHLDLSELAFLDASGLGALVRVARTARARGCELRTTGASPLAHRLLAVTGLLEALGVQPADPPVL